MPLAQSSTRGVELTLQAELRNRHSTAVRFRGLRAVAAPELIFRGVPYPDDAQALLDEIRATVESSLDRAAEEEIRETDLLQEVLHDDLAAFVYERLRRRPMVLPVVVEV